ncbi:MAG: hydroxymethylbilane synthase [Oscillibacter sp.]|nr:hydroxymethylbilane synthase [Oscillibacter sp.]
MTRRAITVGSRESALAVAQARTVVDFLRDTLPGVEVRLLTLKTTGDRILDRTLDRVGGKGLFVRELDEALSDGRADITVHSLKDVPAEIPPSLPLLGFSRREDPRDVLVLPDGVRELDPALAIGSASPRRQLQLRALFPGCDVRPVRGNVQTRLRKLDAGEYGALVLASAGLKRLGLETRVSRYFAPEEMIPAAGQGIIAVQGRAGEDYSCLDAYFDPDAGTAALCERAFVAELGGGCTSPVCAFAQVDAGKLSLRGLYYDGGGRYRVGTMDGDTGDAVSIGTALARRLRSGGGKEFRT